MVKQRPIRDLHDDDTVHDAGVKIIWQRFEEMWALQERCGRKMDADGVHDMRVASRRLRTAMQTFKPCFRDKAFRSHYQCMGELADLLGEVRDRDVLLLELESDIARLPEDEAASVRDVVTTLRAERDEHRSRLKATLDTLDHTAYDRSFLMYLARQS